MRLSWAKIDCLLTEYNKYLKEEKAEMDRQRRIAEVKNRMGR